MKTLVIFVGLSAAMGLLTYAVIESIPDAEPRVRPIAAAGEWVTNPDGSRVCRLRLPIVRGMTFSLGLCEEWQGPQPGRGQVVPWLRSGPQSGTQIHVEAGWKP